MRRFARLFAAMAAAAAGLFLAPARADEVDDLVRRLGVPARYKDHRPAFSVAKQEFTFEQYKGPEAMTFFVVKDRDRHVALIPMSGFHSGVIYVQDFRPDRAPTALRMPTERWHIDTAVGTELRTDAFIPVPEGATDATYDFAPGDGVLTLVRRYRGTARLSKWSHRSKVDESINTTNTFLFRCDPALGYVVEGTYDTRVRPKPARFEYASAATSGRYSVWPGEAACQRIAYTPAGAEGFFGYWANLGATRTIRGGGRCRDGGFVAFLDPEGGWSPAMTLGGSDADLVVCTAHTDHDFVRPWPADLQADAEGMYRFVARHRILALPPEVTRHVWDAMRVKPEHVGAREVMVRFGVPEDFEAQPLPLAGPVRGLPCGGEAAEGDAHSGSKALRFQGRVSPGTAQLDLKPSTRYRLEAWLKAAPLAAGEQKAAEARARAEIEKRRQKGETVADFAGLGPAEAYLTGKFYEWTPHANEWIGEELRTEAVRPGDGWRKVGFDFTTPAWGPFILLAFHADNCTAYLDDFILSTAGPAEGGA